MAAVGVFHLPAAAAHVGVELIAHDGEEPGLHAGARLELVEVLEPTQKGGLHEIVGIGDVAGQRNGKCTQMRDRIQHRLTD
jgi:hypothetical protein